MVVSANTLYQNISIIRRGLRTVGENEDTLIITVPRRGFQIEPGVSLMTIRKDFAQTIEKKGETPPRTSGRWFKHYVPVLWMTGTFAVGICLALSAGKPFPIRIFTIATRWLKQLRAVIFSREMKISKAAAALQAISQ